MHSPKQKHIGSFNMTQTLEHSQMKHAVWRSYVQSVPYVAMYDLYWQPAETCENEQSTLLILSHLPNK